MAYLEESQRQQMAILRQMMSVLCGSRTSFEMPIRLPLADESDARKMDDLLKNERQFSLVVRFSSNLREVATNTMMNAPVYNQLFHFSLLIWEHSEVPRFPKQPGSFWRQCSALISREKATGKGKEARSLFPNSPT